MLMQLNENLIHFILLATGTLLGSAAFWFLNKIRLGGFRNIASEIVKKAEQDADNIRKAGQITVRQSQIEHQKDLENTWQAERRKFLREEERLKQREDKIEGRLNLVEKKLSDVEKREATLIARREQLEQEKKNINDLHAKLKQQLEQASGLSASEAKEVLIARVQDEIKNETANLIRRSTKEAEEEAEKRASKIISTSINRLASQCVSEATVNTVSIPNEEMKGASSAGKDAIYELWKELQASILSLTILLMRSCFQDLTPFVCRLQKSRSPILLMTGVSIPHA